jgi:hypothetical protein
MQRIVYIIRAEGNKGWEHVVLSSVYIRDLQRNQRGANISTGSLSFGSLMDRLEARRYYVNPT